MANDTTNSIARRGARRLRAGIAAALFVALAGACGEPVELVGLNVVPGDFRTPVGWEGGLLSFAVYSDGSSEDVAAETDWVCSNSSVATVEDIGAQGARVTALAPGEAVITATYRDVSGSVKLTVPETW